MEHDMIEPSPELRESAAKYYAETAIAAYDGMQPYERLLRDRLERRKGFDSVQHYTDVVYLLNLLDRARR